MDVTGKLCMKLHVVVHTYKCRCMQLKTLLFNTSNKIEVAQLPFFRCKIFQMAPVVRKFATEILFQYEKICLLMAVG